MTTIYEVNHTTDMVRLYYFATKGEAKKHAAQLKKDDIAEGYPESDLYDKIAIREYKFPATRQGIVSALNWLIESTCHNEG